MENILEKLIEYFEQQLRLQRESKIKYTGEEAYFDSIDVCKNALKSLRQPLVSGSLPCHHNFIQKDTYWKSCTHCGMLAPLGQ